MKSMRGKQVSRLWKNHGPGYVFLLPWLIGLFSLSIIPMSVSLYLSFTKYDFFRAPQWVGFDNYTYMFTQDPLYLKSLKVTFTYVFLGVPLQLLFALVLALLLNRGIAGLAFFRAVYYVPSLLGGSVAIAILWKQVFGSEGIFNQAINYVGIFGQVNTSWVSDPNYALYSIIILLVWQFGSPMIIFLAGLKQIPKDLYEAASIDGASAGYKFFAITFPLLTPILFFNLVMQIISAFQAFTPAFILGGGGGGPLNSTLFYTLYLYISGFNNFEMGYASAMAWVLLLIIAAFTAVLFLTARRWVYYET